MGFSVGNVGKSGTGKVRGPPVDAKTQATVSKRLQVSIGFPQSTVEANRSVFSEKNRKATASVRRSIDSSRSRNVGNRI